MSLVPHIGMLELLLLAAIALIVVGPKDLPRLMRGVGKFVAQARRLANEFMAGFDQMAREAEMDELRQEIDELKKDNPLIEMEEAVKPLTTSVKKAAEDAGEDKGTS